MMKHLSASSDCIIKKKKKKKTNVAAACPLACRATHFFP